MTQYTLKATAKEADELVMGEKSFVFRSNQYEYKVGDKIAFRVVNMKKSIAHPIEKLTYEITYASTDAPVERGFAVLGLRRIA